MHDGNKTGGTVRPFIFLTRGPGHLPTTECMDRFPRRLLVVLGMPLALLGGGCDGSSGGTPVQDSGTVACGDRVATMAWLLTPRAATFSGSVVRKAVGPGGWEDLIVADDGGAEFTLGLRLPSPVPIASGERIEVNTAERGDFAIYRTLEIRRDGAPVLYATEIEQPDLPPPLRLEGGDAACAANLPPAGGMNYHRLVAYDGDQPITIDVGQQARVGQFLVHNDLIQKFTVPVLDATDTFRVAVILAAP
jgi:hypothetical protein